MSCCGGVCHCMEMVRQGRSHPGSCQYPVFSPPLWQISSILLSCPQIRSVNILNCQCASTCFSWLIFYHYQSIINILRKRVPKMMTRGLGNDRIDACWSNEATQQSPPHHPNIGKLSWNDDRTSVEWSNWWILNEWGNKAGSNITILILKGEEGKFGLKWWQGNDRIDECQTN